MSLGAIALAQPVQAAASAGALGVIAIDVDEVLCRYCEAFLSWYSGRPIAVDPGQAFRACYAPGVEAARAAFLDTEAFVEIDTVQGALEALVRLRSLGFDLQAVTARPESCKGATERYLAKYFPGLVSAVHIARAPHKGSICRAIGARVLIDDQLANAFDAASHGLKAVVLDVAGQYEWNHTSNLPPNVLRMYSWEQTVDWIVQAFGVPSQPSAAIKPATLRFPQPPQVQQQQQIYIQPPAQQAPSVGGFQQQQHSQHQNHQGLGRYAVVKAAHATVQQQSTAPASLGENTPAVEVLRAGSSSLASAAVPAAADADGGPWAIARLSSAPAADVAARRAPLFVEAVPAPIREPTVAGAFVYQSACVADGAAATACGEGQDVMLEAMHSNGVDVAAVPERLRRMRWRAGVSPMAFGRQEQFEMLFALVPDEQLRNYVSRVHFELVWKAPGTLHLRKLSSNLLLVDGAVAPAQELVPLSSGAVLGLCGPDGVAPFLKFQVRFAESSVADLPESTGLSPKAQQRRIVQAHVPVPRYGPNHTGTSAAAAVAVNVVASGLPPAATPAADDERSSLALSCVFARGRRPGAAVESLDMPGGSTFTVGRQHQPGFFERLLGSEPRFLGYVSRSHLELRPLSPGGTFMIKNHSINPVVVDSVQLDKGEEVAVSVPANIDFVAGEVGFPGAVAYLSLRLERVKVVSLSASAAPAENKLPAVIAAGASQLAAAGLEAKHMASPFILGGAVHKKCLFVAALLRELRRSRASATANAQPGR